MSNGDDETTATDSDGSAPDPEKIVDRLDAIEESLEAASTEAELDDIEAELDVVDEEIEQLPAPDEDEADEDEESPRVRLQERADESREELEEQRGPYASDATEEIESIASQITDTRWTEQGDADVASAVETFVETVSGAIETDIAHEPTSADEAATALEAAIDAVESAQLHPDDNTETIEIVLEATETLQTEIDEAQEWSDLTVRKQLERQGFYDVLTPKNRKDYPPELTVIRIAESDNDPEPILLALDKLASEFMEENCLDALARMGPQAAFEEMNQRAQRRGQKSIEVLGKIGDDRAVETLVPFIEEDGDPVLQTVTLKALGEIGSEEATQAVANRLVADSPSVRSAAAKALGRIGDTRAVEPLAEQLDDDDDDTVRASAAWALNRIGTRTALEHASDYDDDRSYLVQAEAERATTATADNDAEAV
ncbi:HEAT repeat domain-containing protein [Halocatena pleomorpha]|uniref:HEAT repeat domain-containing protein n=1 Tax=Halocatena pleomorpha TaxID=1785090 RepID=A0A3P3RGC4_9EURY|nr:HEAT repeat domain-containing protein [Halocatena pleomorpha]RRJ31978.1 HEAT repeat domain-containing protein [Halocatena pleomorpha]